MIKNIIGDATNTGTKVIAHQTNCIGVMGAGIAKQIKGMMSLRTFLAYKKVCKKYGSKLLGHVQYLYLDDGRIIANLFGENVPTKDKVDTDYDALKQCLLQLHQMAYDNGYDITIPGLMGCGLAGGDWYHVLHEIIEPIFSNSEVELTIAYFLKEDYDKYVMPDCFVSNNDPYPLCKGCGEEKCKNCCIYEDYENYNSPYTDEY